MQKLLGAILVLFLASCNNLPAQENSNCACESQVTELNKRIDSLVYELKTNTSTHSALISKKGTKSTVKKERAATTPTYSSFSSSSESSSSYNGSSGTSSSSQCGE